MKKKEIPIIVFNLATKIKYELNKRSWSFLSNKDLILLVEIENCEYSYDAIKSIERNFSKENWTFKMINYYRGDKIFSYTFKMSYNGKK